MYRIAVSCFSFVAACFLISTAVMAGTHDAADFPLRVHIYSHEGHSHYAQRVLDYVDGEGRANLFADGQPTGFDYSYRCGERLMNSIGYETYMARWKKPGKTLEILRPVMGKPNDTNICELKVDMKAGMAYFGRNGSLGEEPSSVFKQWMEKVQYDPEHGKDMPIPPVPATAPAAR
jgi:hypothetical protein